MVLARAAAVVGSCIADDGIDRNLSYMWASDVNHGHFWNRTVLQADCLAASKCGCGAVDTCLGFKGRAGTAAAAPSCAGQKIEECEEATPGVFVCLSVDCASVGLSCDPVASCAETPVAPCGGADCAAVGLACAEGQCVGAGATCTGSTPTKGDLSPAGLACAGPMLDACVGGKRATIDCAKLGTGFSCQSAAGKFFCGLGSECVPGDPGPAETTCEGTTVVFCNAGRVARVDCTSLGFTGCEVDRHVGHYGCVPTLTL